MSGFEIAGLALAGVSLVQGLSGSSYQSVTTTTKVRRSKPLSNTMLTLRDANNQPFIAL